MIKTKTLILSIVLSLVLLAGTITPIVTVLMPKSSGFQTGVNDTTTNTVTVPELIDSSGKVNPTNWYTLLQYLSGTTDLSNVTTDTKTATDIRGFTYNGKTNTQSLLVTLGGIKWIAVYLSTNTSRDKILTLWQADATEVAKWNEIYQSSTSDSYRSNLYGTSKIRSVTLGNGGPYYSSNTATVQNNNKTGTYAQFTNGIYTKYLEQPQNISWQVSGTSAKATAMISYDLNNDNLYNNADNMYRSEYNYNDLEYYRAWGSDYVWLPSLAETGYSDTRGGLWKVNNNERSTSTTYGSGYCWLRSAYYSNTYYASTLYPNSDNYNTTYVYSTYPVRPALHLNLNAVATCAITTAVYMNGAGTVNGGGAYDYGTTHTLTATPNEGYEFYGWVINNDLTNTTIANPVTFTLTEDVTYIAIFHKKASGVALSNSLAVLLECSNETNLACVGTVATNGYTNLTANDMEVHITATPSRGYRFVGWKIDGELSSKYTESAEDVLISDVPNGIIVAYFEKITNA